MDDQGIEDGRHPADVAREEEAAGVQAPGAQGEVQRLGETIAKLKVIPRERVEGVLDKFRRRRPADRACSSPTPTNTCGVLRKALGEDKANLLIDRILQGADVTGIESLKWMDAGSVAELLRNEHPQIVAAILVHLDFDQAASVLKPSASASATR